MISEGFLWCDTVSQEHMVCGPEGSFPTTSYFRGKRLYKILASWNLAYTLLIIAVPLFPICLTPRNPLPSSLTNNYRLLPLIPAVRCVGPRSASSQQTGPRTSPCCLGQFSKIAGYAWPGAVASVLHLFKETITQLPKTVVSLSAN